MPLIQNTFMSPYETLIHVGKVVNQMKPPSPEPDKQMMGGGGGGVLVQI